MPERSSIWAVRVKNAALFVGGTLVAVALTCAIALRIVSAGTTNPVVDSRGRIVANSVASAEMIRLGGLEQFVLTRGLRRTDPVLLVLHGGPGDAEAALFRHYNRELEDHFVVVHWDQRGAGRSFNSEIPPETMTIEQLVSDAHELSMLLRARFRNDRIFVMGHSWGSYLGLRLVHEHPEEFAAFVGIGQVADQAESERLSFEWALREARRRGNETGIRELEELGLPTRGRYRGGVRGLGIQRKWVRTFGGAAYGRGNLGALWMFAWPTLTFREYRIADKLQFVEAEAFSMEYLEEPMLDDPPAARMLEFEVPMFILQGRHDHQTEFGVAEAYFNELQAPHKELIVFEDAAHLVPFEKPEAFMRAMVDRVLPWTKFPRHPGEAMRMTAPSSTGRRAVSQRSHK